MTTTFQLTSKSQIDPRTGLHPLFNAFDAFFMGLTTAVPEKQKPERKRKQILTPEQLARQHEMTARWLEKNRDSRNAKRRAMRAGGLHSIPSRDVLAYESKAVNVASSRFATA